MTAVQSISDLGKKTTAPLYAYIGAYDPVVSQVKEAASDLPATAGKVKESTEETIAAVRSFKPTWTPSALKQAAQERTNRARARYEELAARGQDVVEKFDGPEAVKSAFADVKSRLAKLSAPLHRSAE